MSDDDDSDFVIGIVTCKLTSIIAVFTVESSPSFYNYSLGPGLSKI